MVGVEVVFLLLLDRLSLLSICCSYVALFVCGCVYTELCSYPFNSLASWHQRSQAPRLQSRLRDWQRSSSPLGAEKQAYTVQSTSWVRTALEYFDLFWCSFSCLLFYIFEHGSSISKKFIKELLGVGWVARKGGLWTPKIGVGYSTTLGSHGYWVFRHFGTWNRPSTDAKPIRIYVRTSCN